MVELWALVIIICFDLAFLAVVFLRPDVMNLSIFQYLFLSSQLFLAAIVCILLKRHLSRLYISELREASVEQRKTWNISIKGQEMLYKSIEAQQKVSLELIDRLDSLKNLPPS